MMLIRQSLAFQKDLNFLHRGLAVSADSKPGRATIRLYRILLKQLEALRLLFPEDQEWILQPPLHPRNYGHAQLWKATSKVDVPISQVFRSWKEADQNIDLCMWTTTSQLKEFIQKEFRSPITTTAPQHEQHRLAIEASQSLVDQLRLLELSSVSLTQDETLRVVATSSCIGSSSSKASRSSFNKEQSKYQFGYRIRIENISSSSTFQLLGRTWRIYEQHSNNNNNKKGGDGGTSEDDDDSTPPILVDAPTTGAVGHLPVLEPGDVFTYMSGCQLVTREGRMEGSFHLAKVPPATPSARVGDPVEALLSTTVDKFQVEVKEFPLRVPADRK